MPEPSPSPSPSPELSSASSESSSFNLSSASSESDLSSQSNPDLSSASSCECQSVSISPTSLAHNFNPGVNKQDPTTFIENFADILNNMNKAKDEFKKLKAITENIIEATKAIKTQVVKKSPPALGWGLYKDCKDLYKQLKNWKQTARAAAKKINKHMGRASKLRFAIKGKNSSSLSFTINVVPDDCEFDFSISIDEANTTWRTNDPHFGKLSITPSSGTITGSKTITVKPLGNLGSGRLEVIVGACNPVYVPFEIDGLTQEEALAIEDAAYQAVRAVGDENDVLLTQIRNLFLVLSGILIGLGWALQIFVGPGTLLGGLFLAFGYSLGIATIGLTACLWTKYMVQWVEERTQHNKNVQKIKNTYPEEN